MRARPPLPGPVFYRSILNVLTCRCSSAEAGSITPASSQRWKITAGRGRCGAGVAPRWAAQLLPKETPAVLASVTPPFVCVIRLELSSRVQTNLREGYRDLSQSLTSHRRSTGDKEERNLLPDEGTCITDGCDIYQRVSYARLADSRLLIPGLWKLQTQPFQKGIWTLLMVWTKELCLTD